LSDNPLLTLAAKFRYRLDNASEADLTRLVNAYGQLAERLKDKIDLLTMELEANPDLTSTQVARMSRYQDLIAAVAGELQKYGVYLETELGGIANNALAQSTSDATRLIGLALSSAGVRAGVNKIPASAIKTLLGFLDHNGPLYQRLQELAPLTAQRVADKILEGVGLGYNPAKVAGIITDQLGWGLTDALRWARTTQMWTYREASRANFADNGDILDGWIWFAILDSSVPPCESCLANHGQLFPLDQTLDDHYNGRCVEIPHVAGSDNPVDQSGEDWFNSLDESTQADILGKGKLAAYQDGQFDFSQLTQQVDDPVFGTMRVGVSLKDLLGE
jgi:hypothetical protein